MKKTIEEILNIIAQTIYDKKGFNIIVIDVRKISSMTDYYIIAEGNVDKHVISLSKAVIDELQKWKINPYQTEGAQEGDWVVTDFGDVIVHLLTPEMRTKYELEQLWKEGKIVDVEIKIKGNYLEDYV